MRKSHFPAIESCTYISSVKLVRGFVWRFVKYRKQGKIRYGKLSRFSWFSGVARKFFCKYLFIQASYDGIV